MTSAARQARTAPIERELAAVREVVLRRGTHARERAEDLEQRAERLHVRAALIAALAAANADREAARPKLLQAIEAAQALGLDDGETLLDLALAQLVAGRVAEAGEIVWAGLRIGAANLISPAQLMAFTEELLGDRRHEEARKLVSIIAERLTRRPDGEPVPSERDADRDLSRRAPMRRRRFLEQALSRVDRRLRDEPQDATLLYFRAATLLGLGRVEEALGVLRGLVRSNPADVAARKLLVAALARERRPESAIHELGQLPAETATIADEVGLMAQLAPDDAAAKAEEALASGTGDPADLAIAHAGALMAGQHYDKAAARVNELIDAQPDRPEPWRLRADLLQHEGRDEEAIAALREACSRRPDDSDARARLAGLLEQHGRLREALDEMRRAIAANPARAELLVVKARILLELGRTVEALDTIEAVPLEEGPGVAAVHGDVLVALGRDVEACSWYAVAFDRTAEPDGDDKSRYRDALEEAARRLFQSGRFADALMPLDHLRQDDALTNAGMGMRAELLRLLDRPRAAVDQASAALARYRTDMWIAATQGHALTQLSRCEEALTLLNGALAKDPGYVFARAGVVMALHRLERGSEALDILDAHFPIDRAPEGWESWSRLWRAQLLISLGRHVEARDYLEPSVGVTDPDVGLLGSYAVACGRQGDRRAAVSALRKLADRAFLDMQDWVCLELGNGLAVEAGSVHPEAAAFYERVGNRPESLATEDPTPLEQVHRAWARFRLGEIDVALDEVAAGLQAAQDPLVAARMMRALILAVDQPGADAEGALEAALAAAIGLRDRARGQAILDETAHLARLLRADAAWTPQLPALDAFCRRLTERTLAE